MLLRKAFDEVNRNFNEIQMQVNELQLRNVTLQKVNRQLAQLLNWIATTNPQILDEFQTTTTAFDKLIPRDAGGSDVACAQA
jgi:hypothetical protein